MAGTGAIPIMNAESGINPNGTIPDGMQVAYDLALAQVLGSIPVTANLQTASYVLALTDAGSVVEMNAAGANNVTVPTNATVAFPIGTILEVCQIGAGQTTLVAASGVTLDTPAGLKISAQFGTATLRKRGTDEWVVGGYTTA